MGTSKTMLAIALIAGVAAGAACGGKSKGATPPSDVGDGEAAVDGDDSNPNMVPPERMDEIKALLDRKRTTIARCLPDAIDAGKAEKNARGRVTLEFVISPQGRATDIKVAQATLGSTAVQDCTKAHVATIEFGALPQPLEFSYTYSFEAY
jgi:TonB family protein